MKEFFIRVIAFIVALFIFVKRLISTAFEIIYLVVVCFIETTFLSFIKKVFNWIRFGLAVFLYVIALPLLIIALVIMTVAGWIHKEFSINGSSFDY